jgi:D-amino-acid oxidase
MGQDETVIGTGQCDVVVVGAGVSGLTTAVCLAEDGLRVRVWTADAPQRTTSAVAGAMWGPSFVGPPEKVLGWLRTTLAELTELAARPGDTGVHLARGRMVARSDLGTRLPPQVTMIPELERCRPEELPEGFVSGYWGTVPLVDMPRYLDHLEGRLVRAGCRIELRSLHSLSEAMGEAPVVVNCTGVGARRLTGDQELRPMWGQHVVVENPGLDEFFAEIARGAEWANYFPHGDHVVLGGIAKADDWSLEPDPVTAAGIVERCARVEPRLRDARVVGHLVGLRPDRPAVRVERETLEGPTGDTMTCVHNYGHGGTGVSLSWGCAREAAALVAG